MKNKIEYRIENGSLIIDNYFNNLKIGSVNCGVVESILGKCNLFDEEYVALLKENQQLKKENQQLKDKLSKIETLITNHNRNIGDIYYKYNNRFLKSELKQRILEIVYEESDE